VVHTISNGSGEEQGMTADREPGRVVTSTMERRANDLPQASALSQYLAALGPLRPLMEDDSVTEIMVVGPYRVYVERNGRIALTDVRFDDQAGLVRVIDAIVNATERHLDARRPLCHARLLDGSRVAVSLQPVAVNGPLMTIRKFTRDPYAVEDLITFGTLTREAAAFLHACVLARANIVISGGTGAGKTTLLNVCSSFIPQDERIVTIEDAAELRLRQEHVCTLESRPASAEGDSPISLRDLVVHSLRMRPDRIIVGECRGVEALDMLQAMNTGHDGSLTTIHASSPRDCLARLEVLALMSGLDLPARAVRQQIASAVDLIVQLARLRDGSRRIVSINEVTGTDGDTITMQDIFHFEAQGSNDSCVVVGDLRVTGTRPKTLDGLLEHGIPLPDGLGRLFPPGRGRRAGDVLW
jgi:pilus assembly protein CpaF